MNVKDPVNDSEPPIGIVIQSGRPRTRLWEHRTKQNPKSFTSRYNIYKLVYYEPFELITDAIDREKYLKGKSRQYKEDLINKINPGWQDLTDEVGSPLWMTAS